MEKDLILGLIIGIPLGIGASFIAWWIVTHKIIPKVLFATIISKQEINNTNKYRLAFMNSGKRKIIDVQIKAEIILKGIDEVSKNNISHIRLNISKNELLKVSPNIMWTISIRTKKIPKILSKKYPDISFEEILKLEKVALRLSVFGYDAYSGARKLHQSQDYNFSHIESTKFDKKKHFKEELNRVSTFFKKKKIKLTKK